MASGTSLTTTGDIAVNGGDITATGDLNLNPGGGNVTLNDADVLNIGGANLAYNSLANSAGGTTSHTLSGDNDLYIEGNLEVDSASYIDSTLTVSGAVTGATFNSGLGAMELGDTTITAGDTTTVPRTDAVYNWVTGLGYGTGTITGITTTVGSCTSGTCSLLNL